MANRDIFVIGASAGGVDLLLDLVGELPERLPAAIFVMLHTGARYLSELPKDGSPAELVCPMCHGVLTEVTLGEFRHYRCHVGHAFSLDSLLGEQSEDVERALWAAVRSLEEGAALSWRLNRSQADAYLRRRFADKGEHLMRQADVIRRILLHGEPRLEEAPGSSLREP